MLSALLFGVSAGGAVAIAIVFVMICAVYVLHGAPFLAIQALAYSGIAAMCAVAYGILAFRAFQSVITRKE